METENYREEFNDKISIKTIITFIFLAVFAFSLSLKCIEINFPGESESISLFEVKGISLTITALVIYLYALFTKKKIPYLISILGLIGAFIYTSYAFINTTSSLDSLVEIYGEELQNYIQYKSGILFYYISHLILFISIIIPNKKSNKVDQTSRENLEEEKIKEMENKGNYILANYVYGFEQRPELYNKLAAIATSNEIDTIEITVLNSDLPAKLSIQKNKIKCITVKTTVIAKDSLKVESYGMAENIRDIALLGPVSGTILGSVKSDKINDYYKMKTTTMYDILIEYQNDLANDASIMLQAKKDPEEFFKIFNEKYIRK